MGKELNDYLDGFPAPSHARMKVTGFNHFAIRTRDIESSLVFYRDILGLKQLATVKTDEFSSTNLIAPDGCVVELLDMNDKGPQSTTDAAASVHHLAFDVDDVQASEVALRNSGIEIVASCTDLERFNTKVVQCRDPNGVVIALRKNLR